MMSISNGERRERVARYLELPAADVVKALDQYGAELRAQMRLSRDGDHELERTLLMRKDRLITLALARNASDPKVLASIFNFALAHSATSDAYIVGLRTACLSNCVVDCGLVGRYPDIWMDRRVFEELLQLGDDTECQCLLVNPLLDDAFLESLYRRNAPFDRIERQRWLRLVQMSSLNSRLVTNEDSEDGPDLGFTRIQAAILDMFVSTPLSDSSQYAAANILEVLNPFQLPPADSAEKVRNLLDQWRAAGLASSGKGAGRALHRPFARGGITVSNCIPLRASAGVSSQS